MLTKYLFFSENGGATMTKPDGGWDDEELGKLFSSSWPSDANGKPKPEDESADAEKEDSKDSGANAVRTSFLLMTLPFMIASLL
jgi:hypothetical protein